MGFSLATNRLVLNDMTQEDLPYLCRIARTPEIMQYVLLPLANDEQVGSFLRHAIEEAGKEERLGYILAIRDPETQVFAGFTSLEIDPNERTTAEVGCLLVPEYWGSGYALEILHAFLAFGFGQLALHRIYGKCDDLNHASGRVMEKGGMTPEGTIREHVWLRNHWRSSRHYGILAREYTTGR